MSPEHMCHNMEGNEEKFNQQTQIPSRPSLSPPHLFICFAFSNLCLRAVCRIALLSSTMAPTTSRTGGNGTPTPAPSPSCPLMPRLPISFPNPLLRSPSSASVSDVYLAAERTGPKFPTSAETICAENRADNVVRCRTAFGVSKSSHSEWCTSLPNGKQPRRSWSGGAT